jgi:hypothetical protein
MRLFATWEAPVRGRPQARAPSNGLRSSCTMSLTSRLRRSRQSSAALHRRARQLASRARRCVRSAAWRMLFERRNSTEPVPRPGSPAPRSIGWICKLAFIDRKTSASDALRQPCSETLKLGNPLIDPPRPLSRKAGPVPAGRNTIGRKLGELHADFLERQPNPLREHDERYATQHGSRIASMP